MKSNIIALTKHPEILAIMVRLIDKREDTKSIQASSLETTKQILQEQEIKGILLGSGFSNEEENELKNYVAEKYPDVKIIAHYGGGSGLLDAELNEAFK